MINWQTLMNQLGYSFKNESLLWQALTHRSFSEQNNERLEFLGDAILGFIIGEALYRRHPDIDEGKLSHLRSYLVNGESLSQLAQQLGLEPYLQLGVGETRSGGRQRQSTLSDAMEALIGAIYLDSDLENCRCCVLQWYGERLNQANADWPQKDAKTRLQEWAQAKRLPLPIYEIEIAGPAHDQTFTAHCSIKGLPHVAMGVSHNRRKAEQVAAEKLLGLIND